MIRSRLRAGGANVLMAIRARRAEIEASGVTLIDLSIGEPRGPLSHVSDSVTLTEVAPDFPDLSWCEAFTAAKLIGNGAGWHVGAMAGSPDFIGDLKTVKGKTDTGFVAPMAVGALAAFDHDRTSIDRYREIYRARLERLNGLLTSGGMRLALEPAAGFFSLWRVPDTAFEQPVDSAEHFNFMMMERTGLAGVHFPGYVRYAVCSDIEASAAGIERAFAEARVAYR